MQVYDEPLNTETNQLSSLWDELQLKKLTITNLNQYKELRSKLFNTHVIISYIKIHKNIKTKIPESKTRA